ncbi:MAG: TIR domain-containing protein [Anaerolineae bacterium]|jgi:hypothetical protein
MSEQAEHEYDVFISHSHADREWVSGELLPRLEEAGLKVIVDFRDFEIGVPSLVNMERAVDQSRHTLVVLTPEWLASEWADFEGLLVGTADPAARRRKLIPLMLRPCDPPRRIAMLTYADFTKLSERKDAMARLVQTLSGQAGAVAAPPLPDVPELEEYERELKDILERLDQRRLVIFVGADLPESVAGLPGRQALADALAAREGIASGQRLATVAQQVMSHSNRWAFTNFLREAWESTDVQPGPFYRQLAQLVKSARPDLVITTAYHRLLEWALRDVGDFTFNNISREEALPFADPNRPTLLKLYGDLDQVDTLVVTEQDQNALRRGRNKPDMVDEVRRAFRRNSVLFLGYDLSDPAVSALFDEVAGDRFQIASYAVWSHLSEHEMASWRSNRGLTVLKADPVALIRTLLDRIA